MQNKLLHLCFVDAAAETAFLGLQCCQRLGNLQRRCLMQQFHHIIFIYVPSRFLAQCIQNTGAELERACGRCDQCLGLITGFLAVIFIYLNGYGSMCVAGIAILLIDFCNGCLCLSVIAEASRIVSKVLPSPQKPP